ncbi:serine--tRNA ligase [Marinilabiliaceae bacterium ANBcel2]|nr:serine--tRNA ligase [Marinilabiliaceae bacterium ANBcel2]
MLTLNEIKNNREDIVDRLKIKNFKAEKIIDDIIALDKVRRSRQVESDELQSEIKKVSKSIGSLLKEGKSEEADVAKKQTAKIKELIKEKLSLKEEAEQKIIELIVLLPNVPHLSVPAGSSAEDNAVVDKGGSFPQLTEELSHWDIAKKFDIIDFELGVKLTGSGFPVYKGKGARLQRALISFFLDEAEKAGYDEVLPPLLVNEESGFGTGQLPDKEGQMYHIENDDLYLIPTAEVPVTNIYRDVILDEKSLPLKNCAYSACFRREAGSYGKDVRGLNRLHQFDKVEIVQVAHPNESYRVLDEMLAHVKQLLDKLQLPWRMVKLCGGDMSFTAALTYDFEVYSAAQKRWLEVSSVSNFEDFQSNRLKLRYRGVDDKRPLLAHTLNGSALALPRIMAALLENNQLQQGISIPEVLVPYCGFDKI